MKKKPKITVITPTYNRARLLPETIESVLNQSFKEFEYYILDDGSTDETKRAVAPYLKDKRVKYLKKKNQGEAETVNFGWSIAKGQYFTQVNSDDPILPELFSEMVRSMDENPSAVVAYPDFYFINENGQIIKREPNRDWRFLEALSSFSCYAASAGTFIKKDAFKDLEKIKNPSYKHISDVEMYWKMALRGDFLHIPKFLANWRVHDESISAERYKAIPEVLKWYKEFFSQKELPQDVLEVKAKVKNSVYGYCISLISQSNAQSKEALVSDFINEFYKTDILFVGDNDLMGNKFNGHDLHFYLNERNIDSKHLVWNKETNDPETYRISRNRIDRGRAYSEAQRVRRNFSTSGTFNPLWFDVLMDPLFLNSELVHLHLIHNGLVDINLLPVMSKLKPIVWTLHDPWALTGHCVEPDYCEKWKEGCGGCPRLDVPFEIEKDNTAINFELKKEAIRASNIEIIVASEYMFKRVKESPIFKGKNIHLVPFGIDTNLFKSISKEKAKNKFAIPKDAFVISFRNDTRYKKGVDYVEYIIANLITDKKVYFITFGQEEYQKNRKFSYLDIGWIQDDSTMTDVYNASDLFLMPSTIETFGMMAIEAMCCGTVPVVLEGTALPDVVNSPSCGVTSARDKEEFLKVVTNLMENEKERHERERRCIDFAQNEYNKEKYLAKLLKVYQFAKENHHMSEGSIRMIIEMKKKVSSGQLHDQTEINTENEAEEETISTAIRVKQKTKKVLKKFAYKASPSFRVATQNRDNLERLADRIELVERNNNQNMDKLLKRINKDQ